MGTLIFNILGLAAFCIINVVIKKAINKENSKR